VSYRVIIGEYARPVAEKIKKDGSPEIKAHLSWLVDSLSVHPEHFGIEIPHPEFENARLASIGELTGIWTLPGHNIVLLRVLHWAGELP
jgi:hypothetical protein